MDVASVAPYVVCGVVTLTLGAVIAKTLLRSEGGSSRSAPATASAAAQALPPVMVVYATQTGTARAYAQRFAAALRKAGREATIVDAAAHNDVDPWDEMLNGSTRDCVVLLSTAAGGSCPKNAKPLVEDALNEIAHDHRVGSGGFKGRRFAVLGLGSTEYDPKEFCGPARRCERLLRKLGASRVASAELDDAENDGDERYEAWERRAVAAFCRPFPVARADPEYVAKSQKRSEARAATREKQLRDANTITPDHELLRRLAPVPAAAGRVDGGVPSDDEPSDCGAGDDDEEEEDDAPSEDEAPAKSVIDLEDIGPSMRAADAEREEDASGTRKEPREMVTAKQAAALKKEGYKLIGSHSAVKLCRWTKHQLRGRGGCYKHTFYGITSYSCMEATPSLACANKCVFCWRHHKNPVGKEWKWKTDDPYLIVAEAVRIHVGMINEARGVPGVLEDRWRDALTVRHCALSLVGEPIMYPRINELVGELHSRRISTFLVTNAQFPDAIETLRPVTQLYVSVDAPNKEALIEVDRPLFDDAYERLRASLVLLKEKKQRTVARLTLVKGYNADDIGGYAELCALGAPTLIEIKGVTFCGKSDASDLTMENCPWHHEVVVFSQALAAKLADIPGAPKYGVACSHKHSVSVLLARVDELAVVDQDGAITAWKTWIDYEKFHDLAVEHARSGKTFHHTEYATVAPSWALYGAPEEGFDPKDTRLYKKKANGKSR